MCCSSTYRRVEIDEDGTRDVFAIAGFGKEGLEGTALVESLCRLRVQTTVGLETMLEKIPG